MAGFELANDAGRLSSRSKPETFGLGRTLTGSFGKSGDHSFAASQPAPASPEFLVDSRDPRRS
jgi:hypothetical protein